MKFVFICNKEYKDKITLWDGGKGFGFCGVQISYKKEQAKAAEKWEEDTLFMTSADEFDPDKINGFFSDGDFCQNQVFVMPELLWNDRSVDEGYEIALRLLKELADKTIVLRFVSNFTQEQLLQMVNNTHHSLAETFPHICINQIQDGEWKKKFTLKPEAYSATHFQLIRNIAISNWGRLDYIEHQLNTSFSTCSEKKEHFIKLLNELDDDAYQFDGTDEQIKELLKDVIDTCPEEDSQETIKQEYSNRIVLGIQSLIACIRSNLSLVENGEGDLEKKTFKVLVIDDNENERKKLCGFFGKHYENVVSNNERGTFDLTDAQAAKDWLEKHAGEYHIIILDLLFMEKSNSIWLPYNGLDLLSVIPPYCTVRVITSLPRERVGNIAREARIKLDAGQILTKSKGWEPLENCLFDRLYELNKECKEKEPLRRMAAGICMPLNGSFFSDWCVKEHYQNLLNEGLFEETFNEAESLANSKTARPLPLMGNSTILENNTLKGAEKLRTSFVNYLAHRIAFISWAAKKGAFFNIDITDYTTKLKAPKQNTGKIEITKGYLTKIGFSTQKINNATVVNFSIEEMFPLEYKYYYDKLIVKNCHIEKDTQTMKWFIIILSKFKSLNITEVKICEFKGLNYTKIEQFFDACYQQIELHRYNKLAKTIDDDIFYGTNPNTTNNDQSNKIEELINSITDINELKGRGIDTDLLKIELEKNQLSIVFH